MGQAFALNNPNPQPNTNGNVIAVAAGANHSVALKADGTVAAWGDNSYNQTSVPQALANVIAIAAAANQSLALLSNGTLVPWGLAYGTVPSGLTKVTAIAAGETFSLALTSGGTVVAWGLNSSGQRWLSRLLGRPERAAGPICLALPERHVCAGGVAGLLRVVAHRHIRIL